MTRPLSTRVCRAALLALSAAAAACYNRNAVTAPDEILTLTASPSTIPADGFSTTRIEAIVSPHVDRAIAITFSASISNAIASTAFSPDSNGRAVTFLKSTTTPQTVFVTASVKRGDNNDTLASRTIPVVFDRVDSSSIVRLTLASRELPADGASSVQVRADVNAAAAVRSVKFETTNGSFAPNTTTRSQDGVTTDANGVARILLYAPREIGSALVTVAGASFSASDTLSFVRALPDFIGLRALPLSIQKSETQFTTVTATLTRTPGKVTEDTPVEFSIASDATRQAFGRFQNVKRSGENGDAAADFVAGENAPEGLATITASVPGTNLAASVKIMIQP